MLRFHGNFHLVAHFLNLSLSVAFILLVSAVYFHMWKCSAWCVGRWGANSSCLSSIDYLYYSYSHFEVLVLLFSERFLHHWIFGCRHLPPQLWIASGSSHLSRRLEGVVTEVRPTVVCTLSVSFRSNTRSIHCVVCALASYCLLSSSYWPSCPSKNFKFE